MPQKESYRVAAVVGEELGRGLALAGVQVLAATEAEELRAHLREAAKSRRWGVVIVDEALLSLLDERERIALSEHPIPLVIGIPAEMRWRDVEQSSSADFVAMLVRRAVGYQLNIQV